MTYSASPSTSAYPYDLVCYISDTIDGVRYRASGLIIGPHTILTAAHVVWDVDSGQAATSVTVYPSYGASTTGYAGAAIHYNAVDDINGELTKAQSQSDFAIIDVVQDLSSYGSFGIDLNYTGGSADITGYPAYSSSYYTQVTGSGSVVKDASYSVLDYNSSSFGVSPGSSGGPIWVNVGGVAEVVGLVSTSSWGAQLTTADWAQIQGWIAQDAHIWTVHQFAATDVVFRQVSTGDWGYMTANAGGGETWHPVGASSTAYAAIGTGDLNGDGMLDVAFRDSATGEWGFLTPVNGGGETWHDIGATSTAYAVVAVADFNKDGAADIAFRNGATGDLGYMSVNGSGGETWHPVGPTSVDYTPLGAGDFNSDGVKDIAFRSGASGEWGFMTVNLGGGETWHDVGPTSLAYEAIGVGDFDGLGPTEAAFRNTATGDWGYMSVNPSGGETWHPIGATSTVYDAVKVADLNGDGRDDIAFRNPTTGDWGYMSVSPSGVEAWHAVGPTSADYLVIA